MRAGSLLAVVVLSCTSAAASAEENIDCDKAMNTFELNACSQQQLAKADDELNAIYAWTGGSATSGEVLGCMLEMTSARTKDLQNRYELK